VVIGNFTDLPEQSDYSPNSRSTGYSKNKSRSGSVIVPSSSQKLNMNNFILDDIEDKENSEYYEYLKENYTTID